MKLNSLLLAILFCTIPIQYSYAYDLHGRYEIAYKVTDNKNHNIEGLLIISPYKSKVQNGRHHQYAYRSCIKNKDGLQESKSGFKSMFKGVFITHSITQKQLNIQLDFQDVLPKDKEIKNYSAKSCINVSPGITTTTFILESLKITEKTKVITLKNGYSFAYNFKPYISRSQKAKAALISSRKALP